LSNVRGDHGYGTRGRAFTSKPRCCRMKIRVFPITIPLSFTMSGFLAPGSRDLIIAGGERPGLLLELQGAQRADGDVGVLPRVGAVGHRGDAREIGIPGEADVEGGVDCARVSAALVRRHPPRYGSG
jgi:hypothetical protein